MKIDEKQILRVAELARLELTEDEKREYSSQLSEIISYVEKINELDTERIQPTDHIVELKNVFRRDEPGQSMDRIELERMAPRFEDGQVVVPDAAADRHGVQPVVSMTANGNDRADVGVGDAVHLQATAEAAPGMGPVVAVEWDLGADGTLADATEITPADAVVIERNCSFDAPGTYFPALRVTAQRDGDATTPFARVQNVARVRVVVA